MEDAVYNDVQEMDASYYGQRAHVSMAPNTAATAYAYAQASAYHCARPSYTSSSASIQQYSTSGYCKPSSVVTRPGERNLKPGSSIASRGLDFTSSFSSATAEPSGYTVAPNYTTSISPAYLASTNQQTFQHLPTKNWFLQEPSLRGSGTSDISISPPPEYNDMLSALCPPSWNQGFESMPLSPGGGTLGYQSYSSSDLNFSDSESELTSGEQHERKALSNRTASSASQSRRAKAQDDVDEGRKEQSYRPIAPNAVQCSENWGEQTEASNPPDKVCRASQLLTRNCANRLQVFKSSLATIKIIVGHYSPLQRPRRRER